MRFRELSTVASQPFEGANAQETVGLQKNVHSHHRASSYCSRCHALVVFMSKHEEFFAQDLIERA